MRYTCLLILCFTVILAAMLSVIPRTDRQTTNGPQSYLITVSLFFVLGTLYEARLSRNHRDSLIQNYANYSESLEYRVKWVQELLVQARSESLHHWYEYDAMERFLDKYGEEMDLVQQVLDWEEMGLNKSALHNFESDGIEIEKGHRGRGLAFVRLVRLLLDIRIEFLMEHAKYIASLSEGYSKFASTRIMCLDFKRLELHIEDFWARGWGDIINSPGSLTQDKQTLQRCFEGIPGSISYMAFVRSEWAKFGPWNCGYCVLGYEFQFAKVKKDLKKP